MLDSSRENRIYYTFQNTMMPSGIMTKIHKESFTEFLRKMENMTFVGVNEIRHPQRRTNRKGRRGNLPPWFKVKIRQGPDYREIRRIMDEQGLHTICEEARCPNVWECWNNRTATFLILGDICTRRCHYCAVTTGRPGELDLEEPARVADAIHKLGLRHAVITSVNRDELPDGGASIFAETLRQVRRKIPTCTLEVLIPDFQGSESALAEVMAERPDILNHNIETVPRSVSLNETAGQVRPFPSRAPEGEGDGGTNQIRSDRGPRRIQ